ncbi:MAG: ATP-binding protein [Acidobacteriota bacterium]
MNSETPNGVPGGDGLRGLSIRQKLLGAFGVDLTLMALLGAFALMQMGAMNETASRVGTQTIPSMRNIDQIRDLIWEYRSLQLAHLVQGNAADHARLERSMATVEARMADSFARQRAYLGTDADRETFSDVHRAWVIYTDHNHSRFLPASRSTNTGSVQPASSRLNPLYERLEGAVERLTRMNEQQAQDAMAAVQATYRTSRRFIFVDTLVSLVLSAVVGLGLAATLSRRLGRLTSATRAVAAGDLERRVDLAGGDEVALLASDFDRMVESLRDQHATLQLRNEELRQSLEQQQRLTRDLVLRKESEEAADRARARAEASNSAKSLFLATMSHELRTPLNAILGYAQLLKLETDQRGEGRMGADLGRIQAAGKHLRALIDNLLDFSKIEQGKMELEVLRVEVAALAEEVVEIVRPLAIERRNQLRLRLEGNADLGTLHSDAGKVRQVLFNLLSNAVKFTEGGEITLTVARRTDAGGDRLTFRVADTGIGIESRHLERIFEPFRQADSSIHRRFGGTGLGLVVSRQLAEMLGGGIEVDSEPGVGSEFTVDLPAVIPGLEAPRPRSPHVPGPRPMSTRTMSHVRS